MSHVLKTIEKRMKKFVNKPSDTPSQSKFVKIKLTPIDTTPKQTRKISTVNSNQNLSSLVQSSTDDSKKSGLIQMAKVKSKSVINKVKKVQNFSKNSKILTEFRRIGRKARDKFYDKTWAIWFILWVRRMKRGVFRLCSCFLYRVKSVKCIQKNWRMWKCRKWFKWVRERVIRIQKAFKGVREYRKFKEIVNVFKTFDAVLKVRLEKMTKSAIFIQKMFRKFSAYKKFKPVLVKKVQLSMHQKLIARQSALVKLRNKKKQAVQKIEKEWLKYLNRKRLRQLRKYLKSLPYECRLLYLKFKQVKKETDLLQKDLKQVLKTLNP